MGCRLSLTAMQVRDWAVLIAISAILPWLAIQLVSLAAEYLPLFVWYLDETNSRSFIALSTQIQSQFEHLIFAIPVGALLAWQIRGTPVTTALLVMAGYSLAWLAWSLFAGISLSESVDSLLIYYHIPVILWLGGCVFAFGTLYQRKKRGNA